MDRKLTWKRTFPLPNFQSNKEITREKVHSFNPTQIEQKWKAHLPPLPLVKYIGTSQIQLPKLALFFLSSMILNILFSLPRKQFPHLSFWLSLPSPPPSNYLSLLSGGLTAIPLGLLNIAGEKPYHHVDF